MIIDDMFYLLRVLDVTFSAKSPQLDFQETVIQEATSSLPEVFILIPGLLYEARSHSAVTNLK